MVIAVTGQHAFQVIAFQPVQTVTNQVIAPTDLHAKTARVHLHLVPHLHLMEHVLMVRDVMAVHA